MDLSLSAEPARSFEVLVQLLQGEHEREVGVLREELVELRGLLADRCQREDSSEVEKLLKEVTFLREQLGVLGAKEISTQTGGLQDDDAADDGPALGETFSVDEVDAPDNTVQAEQQPMDDDAIVLHGASAKSGAARDASKGSVEREHSAASTMGSSGSATSMSTAPRKSIKRLKTGNRKKKSTDAPRTWRSMGREFLSGPFEGIVIVAIVMNVVVSYAYIEVSGRMAGMRLGVAENADLGAGMDFLNTLAFVFTGFFAMELVLKMIFFGKDLFFTDGSCQWFHVFDAVIVAVNIADAIIFAQLDSSAPSSGSNISVLRSLRLVRVLRLLHVARTLRFFSSLRVLVGAVFASFYALFWAMVLLSIVMLMGGLFMSQAVQNVITDPAFDDQIRRWAYNFYGTPSRACWSMFELTFSGGWPNYARPLVEEVSAFYTLIFALYISCVVFGMFRIITALFLKDVLRVAAMDVDNTIDEKIAEKELYTSKLVDFFAAADSSGDGTLSLQEFDDVMKDERLKAYLASLELDPTKTRELFKEAGNENDEISIDDFVRIALQVRGGARMQDTIMLLVRSEKLQHQMEGLQVNVASLERTVRDMVGSI